MDFLIGTAGFDEGQELALVVGGAAAGDDLLAADLADGGLEGVEVPEIERIDRLDVVMAVEQDMRRIGGGGRMMADDHRMARGIAH